MNLVLTLALTVMNHLKWWVIWMKMETGATPDLRGKPTLGQSIQLHGFGQEQDYDYDGQIKFRLPRRVAGAKFK
jgi:hypothetical protein